jgi:hypothetical protein
VQWLNSGERRLTGGKKELEKKNGGAAQCRKNWKNKLREKDFGQIFLLCSAYRLQGLPGRGSQRRDEKIKNQFRLIHRNARKLSTLSEGKKLILPERSIFFHAYFS